MTPAPFVNKAGAGNVAFAVAKVAVPGMSAESIAAGYSDVCLYLVGSFLGHAVVGGSAYSFEIAADDGSHLESDPEEVPAASGIASLSGIVRHEAAVLDPSDPTLKVAASASAIGSALCHLGHSQGSSSCKLETRRGSRAVEKPLERPPSMCRLRYSRRWAAC